MREPEARSAYLGVSVTDQRLRHLKEAKHLYRRVSEAGGTKVWFQGMRRCFLAVAERDLLLPSSLTSRLLNRAPIGGVAAGHPEDWPIEQLREPARRIANRIGGLFNAAPS